MIKYACNTWHKYDLCTDFGLNSAQVLNKPLNKWQKDINEMTPSGNKVDIWTRIEERLIGILFKKFNLII